MGKKGPWIVWFVFHTLLIFFLSIYFITHNIWVLNIIKICLISLFALFLITSFLITLPPQPKSRVPRWVSTIVYVVEVVVFYFMGEFFLVIIWIIGSFLTSNKLKRWPLSIIKYIWRTIIVGVIVLAPFYLIHDLLVWLKKGNLSEISSAYYLLHSFKFVNFYSWVYTPSDWFGLHFLFGWIFKSPTIVALLLLIALLIGIEILFNKLKDFMKKNDKSSIKENLIVKKEKKDIAQ